LESIFLP